MLKTTDIKLVTCAGERARPLMATLGMAKKVKFALRLAAPHGTCLTEGVRIFVRGAELPPFALGCSKEISQLKTAGDEDHCDIANGGNFILTCDSERQNP